MAFFVIETFLAAAFQQATGLTALFVVLAFFATVKHGSTPPLYFLA